MAMKICVCVKVVPRAAVPLRLDPADWRLDRSGATELNPPDLFAIEEALRVRDAADEAEIVLVSMGPEETAESLRAGLAMGADRAVLLTDPALAGSDLLGTSLGLASLLEQEHPGLVVFGGQSSDGAGALLWAAVAERLAMPVVAGIRSLTIADGTLRAERQVLGGDESLETPLPCVISVGGSVATVRYPAFRDIVQAKRKEIRLMGIDGLIANVASVGASGARTEVLEVAAAPPRRVAGEVIEDEGRGAQWILDRLTARELV